MNNCNFVDARRPLASKTFFALLCKQWSRDPKHIKAGADTGLFRGGEGLKHENFKGTFKFIFRKKSMVSKSVHPNSFCFCGTHIKKIWGGGRLPPPWTILRFIHIIFYTTSKKRNLLCWVYVKFSNKQTFYRRNPILLNTHVRYILVEGCTLYNTVQCIKNVLKKKRKIIIIIFSRS